jgi:ribose transport system permease protein
MLGVLCAFSALLFAGRLESISSSNAVLLYELDAIAAVVIGGAAMSGGRGTVRGTLAGVLVLGIVTNILDLWGVNVSLQGSVKGLVIVVSVLVQRKGTTTT